MGIREQFTVYMPHYVLSFQWGKTDSETVNRLMMVIHGTYED